LAKAKPKAPADKLALYGAVIAAHPKVARKGAANVYTSLNGHMFSFMDETGTLSLRLPSDAREQFLLAHNTKLSFQHNTVMKEYVLVPDAILADFPKISAYFSESYAYVDGLKPKPTRKKK